MKKSLSLILTVALLLTFAAFALGSGDSDSTSVEKGSAKSSKSSSSEKTEVNVGDTLNANDIKITYDSAEKWSSSNQFIQPGEGKQFIRLHFTISNETNSDQYIGMTDFECYADGEKCDMSIYGDDTLTFDKLSSGRKISGYVYYEVPVSASDIEVEYETSFWTDKKAYFIVKL